MLRAKLCAYYFLVAVLSSLPAFAGEITGTITPIVEGLEVQIEIQNKTYTATTDINGHYNFTVAEDGDGILKIYYINAWSEGLSIKSVSGTPRRYDISIEKKCKYTLKRN